MFRVVRTEKGAALDPRQVLPGRGAYVHVDASCLEAAVKRGGLARTLRCKVGNGLLTGVAVTAPSRIEPSVNLLEGSKKDS
jgi:uncharacterized protein